MEDQLTFQPSAVTPGAVGARHCLVLVVPDFGQTASRRGNSLVCLPVMDPPAFSCRLVSLPPILPQGRCSDRAPRRGVGPLGGL